MLPVDMYLRLARVRASDPQARVRATITETIETSDQDEPHQVQHVVGLPAR